MSTEYIVFGLGVAISLVGSVGAMAIGVLGYFMRKRDEIIDSHGTTLAEHRDRLTRVEATASELKEDVKEIKTDMKSVREDISIIKGSTVELKVLIENRLG